MNDFRVLCMAVWGLGLATVSGCTGASMAAGAQQDAASSALTIDRPLPPNVNVFAPAERRDPLDNALMRLASRAMSADLSGYEPWLYDRATTYYKLGLWSGRDEFLEHALDLVRRYYSMIDNNGNFALKPGDAKYSYVDGAVWFEHETGEPLFRAQAEAVYRLWLSELPDVFRETQGFWTEREIAYALGSALGWYELSNDPEAMERAVRLVHQWRDMAAGSGAPLHTLAQHQEEFEPPLADLKMTSPWMSAFFFEYLRHYHRLTGDTLALQLASDYADFLLENCLYDGSVNHRNLAGYLMPYYLCGPGGSYYDRETPSEGDGEHTPDVMGIMAFAVFAKHQLGLDTTAARRAYRNLRDSAVFFVSRRSNVNPPRKMSWWFTTSYDATYLAR